MAEGVQMGKENHVFNLARIALSGTPKANYRNWTTLSNLMLI